MEPRYDLLDLLSQAGWTMAPLYVCSLAAVAVIVRKLAQFWLHGVSRVEGRALQRIVDLAREAREARPETAEREAETAALEALEHYDSWLPLLAFIAQVAPLFGLLGTVLGMVDLFGSMELAGAEASTATLSRGIWKALLTTAAGLMIAIPALGFHMLFTRQLTRLQVQMERRVGAVLAGAAP